MSRPLFKLGVVALETLFSRSKADPRVLNQLMYELRHRDAARALALLKDVDAALKALGSDDSTASTQEWTIPTVEKEPSVGKSMPSRSMPVAVQPDLLSSLEMTNATATATAASSHAAKPEPELPKGPSMTLADARAILGVSASASWEEVEERRRNIVQKAFPTTVVALMEAARIDFQDRADRANAAYSVLLTEEQSDRS